MNLIDLENLSGLSFMFWTYDEDEEENEVQEQQSMPIGKDLATKLP